MNNTNTPKILIVGGAGYVGTALAQLYERQGVIFKILDHFEHSLSSIEQCVERGWAYAQCNILDEVKLTEEIASYNPTRIVHLAALHFIPYCNEHPTETVHTNIVGLRNVIHAINAHNSSIELLFSSSAAVYASKLEPLTENDELCPSDIYGLTKYAGEKLIKDHLHNYKIARLFNVCGKHDPNNHLLPKVYQHATTANGTPLHLGARDTKRDYIHVDDVAAALYAIQQTASPTKVFNVGTGRAYSVEEVVSLVLQHTKSSSKVAYLHQAHLRKDDKALLRSDSSLLRQTTDWSPVYDLKTSVETLV